MKIAVTGFIIFLCMSFVGMVSVSSAEMTFPEVKSVGLLKHQVIYSSAKYKIKKTDQGTKAYVKMIARWGLEVYEVGVSEFICKTSETCQFNQWISLATYQSCKVTGTNAKCYGKLGESTGPNSSGESYLSNGHLETYESESEMERTSTPYEGETSERSGESGNGSWEYSSTPF
jgi:hypothetical protein